MIADATTPVFHPDCRARPIQIVAPHAGLVQRTHPDVDVRLLNVLQRLSSEDRSRVDYARLPCRLFFDQFLHRHGIEPPPGPFRDSAEALEAAVEAIDTCKRRVDTGAPAARRASDAGRGRVRRG